MSGQTIRDVVIRVSVESGSMKLDTSAVSSAIKAMQDEIQSLVGNVKIGDTGGRGRSSTTRTAGTSPVTTPNLSDIQKLDVIYGKLNETQLAVLDSMEKLGQAFQFTTQELEKLNEATKTAATIATSRKTSRPDDSDNASTKSAKRRHGSKRNRDHKKEKDSRDAERAQAKAEREQKRKDDALLNEGERGLAEWSRNKKKAARRRAVRNNARVNVAKGVGQFAASVSNSPDLGGTIVQIEGLANIAKNMSAAFEGTALASATVTGGLAVLGAEILVTKAAFDEAHRTMTNYYSSMTEDAARSADYSSRRGTTIAEGTLNLVGSMPYLGQQHRYVQNYQEGLAAESSVREYEATSAPLPFKQAMRQRTLSTLHSEQQKRGAQDRIDFNNKRVAEIDASMKQRAGERVNRKGAERNEINSAVNQQIHATTESGHGWVGRTAWRGLAGMADFGARVATLGQGSLGEGLTGIDSETGMWTSQAKGAKEGQVREQSARQRAAAADVKDAQENNALEREKTNILKENADLQNKMLTTTRAQKQAAYESVQQEKERLKGLSQSFGMSSVATRNQQMRNQKKGERIKAQREANLAEGRAEHEGVERFTDYEMQFGGAGGTEDEQMEWQARNTTEQSGRKFRTDLADREEHLAAEDKKEERPDKVADAVSDASDSAKQFEQHLKDAIPLQFLLDSITRVKQEMDGILQEYKFKSQNRVGS